MFKKAFFFVLLLSVIVTVSFVVHPARAFFSDVDSGGLNYDAINYVESEGIVSGYGDGTFGPNNQINRAEFTKIIIGSEFGQDEIDGCVPGSVFSDVSGDEWFAPYVCVASNKGIINGYADGSFGPGNMISFTEAAKIIVNALGDEVVGGGAGGVAGGVAGGGVAGGGAGGVADGGAGGVADGLWYQPFVEKLEERNAVASTIYSLERSIKRGEMAEMIYRLKEGVTDKASPRFFTGDADLIGNTTFVETYRFYDNNHGWGVWPTKEGEYVLAGWTLPGLDTDAFISKINRQGELLWTKLIGSMVHYSGPMGTGPADDEGYLVTQLEDGSYLLAGQTNGYVGDAEAEIFETATDVFLSKFDQEGNHIWTETVGDLAGDTPAGLWPTDDGGFLLLLTLGELNAGAAEVGDEDHYFALIKFDTEGNEEWVKKTNLNIGGTMGDRAQVDFFMEREDDGATPAGGFVLVGVVPFDEVLKAEDEEIGSHMPAVVKLDENGEVEWAKSIEAIPWEYLIAEEADNEIGYIEKYVKARWAAGNFSAVQKTPDDGYLAIGLLSPFTNQVDFNPTYETITGTPLLAVKLDEDGNFEWAKTIETGLLSFDQEFKIVKTGGNDFVIMFNFMSGGEEFVGGAYDAYMEKMEEVYKLCEAKDCEPGDEQSDPELKAAYEAMNQAQDVWAADMTSHIGLMKVDPEFNVKWVRKIGPEVTPTDIRGSTGTPYQFTGSDIRIDNDQGIIIAGTHGTDVVCSVSFGIKFYCDDALLIKLDVNGNLVDNSGLISEYTSVSQEDLSQYIVLRDLEPKIVDYYLGMGVKKQEPSSVSAKTAKAATVLSPFMEETVVLNELEEPISSVVSPETAPEPKTKASIYYDSVEPVEPGEGSSLEVHEELLPILEGVFGDEVKLRDSFGGISLDYCFGRLVTEEDILVVQEGLEELGYSLAMELEDDGKLVMSRIGRVMNLLFSVSSKMKGTLNVTW